jgi:hypothetical protein
VIPITIKWLFFLFFLIILFTEHDANSMTNSRAMSRSANDYFQREHIRARIGAAYASRSLSFDGFESDYLLGIASSFAERIVTGTFATAAVDRLTHLTVFLRRRLRKSRVEHAKREKSNAEEKAEGE